MSDRTRKMLRQSNAKLRAAIRRFVAAEAAARGDYYDVETGDEYRKALSALKELMAQEDGLAPARFDADRKALPKTEIVAVMPEDDGRGYGTVHIGQATHYLVRPTKEKP